ncbi:MAG: transporter, partial [Saprospiraceae bacterium]|nr:transporter [Saprospiraceae bacterium]
MGYPSVVIAQAWTKAKNSGFYKLDFTRIASSRVFDTKEEVLPIRPTSNNTLSFYGEYGLINKLTLIGYVPFWVANRVAESKDAAGVTLPLIKETSFGDLDLGFRYQLYDKKGISVSLNVLLGLPTGNSKQVNGLLTGDGEFNQMFKIAAGTGRTKWWTQGAIGFNNRTNNYSDELSYDFELGYKFFNDRLLTILKINGIESLNNGTAKENSVGLYANNVEFSGYGPEILYYISN